MSTSLSAAIHAAMVEAIGIKTPNPRKNSKLPACILEQLRYKTQLGHEYKILLNQYERDKLSIPDTVPSQTLILAKTLFESQKDKVKDLLNQFNRAARRLNIEKCTGKSPAAQRHFWSFVTNKTKQNSDITSVRDEV